LFYGHKVHHLCTRAGVDDIRNLMGSMATVVESMLRRLRVDFLEDGVAKALRGFDILAWSDQQQHDALKQACCDLARLLQLPEWAGKELGVLARRRLLPYLQTAKAQKLDVDNRLAWSWIVLPEGRAKFLGTNVDVGPHVLHMIFFYLSLHISTTEVERSLGMTLSQLEAHSGPLSQDGSTVAALVELRCNGPQTLEEMFTKVRLPSGDTRLEPTDFSRRCAKLWVQMFGRRFMCKYGSKASGDAKSLSQSGSASTKTRAGTLAHVQSSRNAACHVLARKKRQPLLSYVPELSLPLKRPAPPPGSLAGSRWQTPGAGPPCAKKQKTRADLFDEHTERKRERHIAVAERRDAGEVAYCPGPLKTAEWSRSRDVTAIPLPASASAKTTRLLPIYRVYSDSPRLRAPAGCMTLALMSPESADIVVLKSLADLDLDDNAELVRAPASMSALAPAMTGMSIPAIPAMMGHMFDEWGGRVAQTTRDLLKKSLGTSDIQIPELRLGTDCSGLDAPVHALTALKIAHRHLYSCECDKAARSMIIANSLPEHALLWNVCDSLSERVPHVDLYVAGFSCRPFSILHWQTKLLEEPDADCFWGVRNRIRLNQPACFCLENVKGIQRCMQEVVESLSDCGYQVSLILTNPADLGYPVQRPRYYFLGVRLDLVRLSKTEAQQMVLDMWQGYQAAAPRKNLKEFLLPASHKLVKENQEWRRARWQQACANGFGKDPKSQPKWLARHEAVKRQASEAASPATAMPDADKMFLHLARHRDAYAHVVTQLPAKAVDVVVDVSQNLGRMPLRTDGTCPTVTPGAELLVKSAERALIPMEKLSLQNFPLHRLRFPDSLPPRALEKLAGNSMHTEVVGCAMLLTLILVDWSHANARCNPKGAGSKALRTKAGRATRGKMLQEKNRAARPTRKSSSKCRRAARKIPVKATTRKPKQERVARKRSLVVKATRKPKHINSLTGTRWA
ncbi:unnamed protein product, partial [Symbiodinium necroappetens]